MRTALTLLTLVALCVALTMGGGGASAATGDPVLINEIFASHTGTDDTEYVELFGTPGTSLSGLSMIVVESDAFGPGAIDRRFDFKPFHAFVKALVEQEEEGVELSIAVALLTSLSTITMISDAQGDLSLMTLLVRFRL